MNDSESAEETASRRECTCEDCKAIREALGLLDDSLTSDNGMGWNDIDLIDKARDALARVVGASYNQETNRYEVSR